jgi:hypothetical protein
MSAKTSTVNITFANLTAPDSYSVVPKERLLAEKIARTLRQHQARGWQLDRIDYHNEGACVYFWRPAR